MYGPVTALVLIIFILCLVATFMAIAQLIGAARMKGHGQDGTGLLWFIGIFASPIVLGLLTASLPDRGAQAQKDTPAEPKSLRGDLPSI